MVVTAATTGTKCADKDKSQPSSSLPTNAEKRLSFSVANILSPNFGQRISRCQSLNKALSESSNIQLCGPTTQPSTGQFEFGVTAVAQSAAANIGGCEVKSSSRTSSGGTGSTPILWPAWVFCTRYSDRPSSGPRCRRIKRKPTVKLAKEKLKEGGAEEKRPRTAFTGDQLARLKTEFQHNRYLTEKRRQELAHELGLNESQIKIWFQNKRAKIKKQVGQRNPLALQLMAQGLYNHATVPIVEADEDDDDEDVSVFDQSPVSK